MLPRLQTALVNRRPALLAVSVAALTWLGAGTGFSQDLLVQGRNQSTFGSTGIFPYTIGTGYGAKVLEPGAVAIHAGRGASGGPQCDVFLGGDGLNPELLSCNAGRCSPRPVLGGGLGGSNFTSLDVSEGRLIAGGAYQERQGPNAGDLGVELTVYDPRHDTVSTVRASDSRFDLVFPNPTGAFYRGPGDGIDVAMRYGQFQQELGAVFRFNANGTLQSIFDLLDIHAAAVDGGDAFVAERTDEGVGIARYRLSDWSRQDVIVPYGELEEFFSGSPLCVTNQHLVAMSELGVPAIWDRNTGDLVQYLPAPPGADGIDWYSCNACTPDPTATYLGDNNRFKVEAVTRDGAGTVRPVKWLPKIASDSANGYFLGPDNLEFLVKVLKGCGINGKYWVFFAATTNVEFTLSVTDTLRDEVREYTNELGMAANAVTDTSAFATCP